MIPLRLPYIDTRRFLDETQDHIMVAADFGRGKTFTLRGLEKSLYLSHRNSLNDENKEYFTEVLTYNSFPKILDVNQFDYIILDECFGCLGALIWDKVDIFQIIKRLRNFKGRIICLDRDANQELADLFTLICGRTFDLFEIETTKRNKEVKIVSSYELLMDQAHKSGSGIKVILSDNSTRITDIYDRFIHPHKFLITATTCANPGSVHWVFEQVEALSETIDDIYVFCSPKVQEGVSLNHLNYVFSGYVQFGMKDFHTPTLRGLQALHRVRDINAMMVVCDLSTNGYSDRLPIEDDLENLRIRYARIKSGLHQHNTQLNAKKFIDIYNSHAQEHEIGLKIMSLLNRMTNEQTAIPLASWMKELRKSGYSPDISLYEERRKKRKSNRTSTPYLNLINPEDIDDDGEMDERYVDYKERLQMIKEGIEGFNIKEDVRDFKLERAKIDAKKIELRNLLFVRSSSKSGALDKDSLDYQRILVNRVLLELIGADYIKIGSPAFSKLEFKSTSLDDNADVQELKKILGKEALNSNTFFFNFIKRFGFQKKMRGKNKSITVLSNDIDLELRRDNIRTMFDRQSLLMPQLESLEDSSDLKDFIESLPS